MASESSGIVSLVERDMAKWQKLIRRAGIAAE
jgi:hypothetical protein